ncbi:uncharacterized protein MAM_01075 [Metarhizium album ARSEF 1941]|uniref:Uncharacterized protein n=1 Tax=Metarhizium album (strain ARSEF 1941) TaxID=1081103 RepID=A0A0B2X6Q5_METAS|nr:uncharacterized protein MAM_01075 [Metarhizium album ARSEF 1941]KHO02074.1 hypothetical protein MAM_01075 [Metarhizium album ARSEF 1941]
MRASACIAVATFLNLGCAAPAADNQTAKGAEIHPRYSHRSSNPDRYKAGYLSTVNEKTSVKDAQLEVVCESREYDPLEYKDGVKMLNNFCERNWAYREVNYAAVVGDTTVYVCAGEDTPEYCDVNEWKYAERLLDQRCGTGRVGTVQIRGKIYGRGVHGSYKC